MEQSSSWEAGHSSASLEIVPILWNVKGHYHIHMGLPLIPYLDSDQPSPCPPTGFLERQFPYTQGTSFSKFSLCRWNNSMTVPNKKSSFPPFLFSILAKKSRHMNHITCKVIYIKLHYNTINSKDTFSTKTSWVYTTRKEENMGRWWLKPLKMPVGSDKDVSSCSFCTEHTSLHLYCTPTSTLTCPSTWRQQQHSPEQWEFLCIRHVHLLWM